jgi:D-beta-D-heptose 7-phosphate kinase/D-beta-D-heptose 1-phosphate adenosyltransferase
MTTPAAGTNTTNATDVATLPPTSDTLLAALASWRPFTALVVGDFMLDQLVYGDAERLSADAPVPVLLVRKIEDRPGGAANVCLDLSAMRGRVIACGVVGDDDAGRRLRAGLEASGGATGADAGSVSCAGLVTDASRPTTLKRNLIGLAQHRHPQKMFREDHESREPLSRDVEDQLLARVEASLPACDVVCLEDYNKGVLKGGLGPRVIAAARRAGKPVFVDPAAVASYPERYRGATTITPNRTEAEGATGGERTGPGIDGATLAIARRLCTDLDLDACVLTLDKDGALLLERGVAPAHLPTVARTVYDVTGAGDMFLAGLAAARANGCSWADSVRLANAAAGLEVEVFGVEPMPIEKVHASVLALHAAGSSRGKRRTPDELLVEASALRRAGKRVVFTNGCFDVLHAGHVSLLERAAREGDFLVVAINDDASVRRLKGPTRPVNGLDDRARVLSSLACVDAVVPFADDTPLALIRALRPDVLVKGGDYTVDRVVGAPDVQAYGGRVVLAPMVEGKSTTATIAAMKS